MPDNSDTKVLQVLGGQARQDRVVDLILAECRLVSFEAKPPQPTSDVHGGAPVRLGLHDPPGETDCLGCGFFEWSALGPFATGLSQRQVRAWSAMPIATKVRSAAK